MVQISGDAFEISAADASFSFFGSGAIVEKFSWVCEQENVIDNSAKKENTFIGWN